MRMLWSKKLSPYYFLGFVLAAYMQLPSIAVAAIGIIIVVIQWQRDKQIMDLENKQNTQGTLATETNISTEDQEEEDFFS